MGDQAGYPHYEKQRIMAEKDEKMQLLRCARKWQPWLLLLKGHRKLERPRWTILIESAIGADWLDVP